MGVLSLLIYACLLGPSSENLDGVTILEPGEDMFELELFIARGGPGMNAWMELSDDLSVT